LTLFSPFVFAFYLKVLQALQALMTLMALMEGTW